jgi:hypothetical protein
MKPFGTDDDDIELNWILDRNIRISFALADNVYDQVKLPLISHDFNSTMLRNRYLVTMNSHCLHRARRGYRPTFVCRTQNG